MAGFDRKLAECQPKFGPMWGWFDHSWGGLGQMRDASTGLRVCSAKSGRRSTRVGAAAVRFGPELTESRAVETKHWSRSTNVVVTLTVFWLAPTEVWRECPGVPCKARQG